MENTKREPLPIGAQITKRTISPRRLSKNGFVARSSESFEGQGDKGKTTVSIAIAYVEDVLGLTTQPSQFAADRSRSLFSDSLLDGN